MNSDLEPTRISYVEIEEIFVDEWGQRRYELQVIENNLASFHGKSQSLLVKIFKFVIYLLFLIFSVVMVFRISVSGDVL